MNPEIWTRIRHQFSKARRYFIVCGGSMLIGPDTNLYSIRPNLLETDGDFHAHTLYIDKIVTPAGTASLNYLTSIK